VSVYERLEALNIALPKLTSSVAAFVPFQRSGNLIFLAVFEVVVQRSLGDAGGGQNCVQACTLEARSVDLARCRLQQALPRALRITQPSRPTFWILACRQHTNQYAW